MMPSVEMVPNVNLYIIRTIFENVDYLVRLHALPRLKGSIHPYISIPKYPIRMPRGVAYGLWLSALEWKEGNCIARLFAHWKLNVSISPPAVK